MRRDVILRVAAKLLGPPILLFALYVQAHGEFGPGGGFQAGVIFAAAFILYGLIEGVDAARRIVPPALVRAAMALGILIYAGTGALGLALGGNYLDYGVLAREPAHGQHLGITLVELGVGITVASVMIAIFFAFAGRGR
ncbi:MAG: Na(+)/H(+) antiporter subunit B [Alphaproteobacteria bacterium]